MAKRWKKLVVFDWKILVVFEWFLSTKKLKSLQNFYKVFVGFVERNMNKEWMNCGWFMNEL